MFHVHVPTSILKTGEVRQCFTPEIILSAFSSKIPSPGWEGCFNLCILPLAVNLESLFLEFLLTFSGNIQKSKDSTISIFYTFDSTFKIRLISLCLGWLSGRFFFIFISMPEASIELWLLAHRAEVAQHGGIPGYGRAVDTEAWDSASLQAGLLCGSFRVRLVFVHPFKPKA